MKSITVKTSKEYMVHIGSGLMNQIGTFAAQLAKPCKAAVVSDSNVWPLYGHTAEYSLSDAGFDVVHYVFPAGEDRKNTETYISILNFLAENQITRSDLIIALGGGVTGDMTGFAASTYLRGVRYIQVPTSLLAMVDSSVGGKTAIDLPAGKNLVGAFYQPSMVLCDIDVLETLPSEVFRDGCAEVIKYAVLYDSNLFDSLEKYGLTFDRETVISRCVELKNMVVTEDEFDAGNRQKLNLGHTIGHGIEACSNFAVTHGQAVAIGMAIVSRAAASMKICSNDTASAIIALLNHFNLPTKTIFSASQLFEAALSDKKRSGNSLNLIVPECIGSCLICTTPISQIKSFIEAGLS